MLAGRSLQLFFLLTLFVSPYPGAAKGQSLASHDEEIPIHLRNRLIQKSYTVEHITKKPGHYSSADWAAVIDATWGAGLPTMSKMSIFNTFWTNIDQKFACFQDLDVNWDSLLTVYVPEIEGGVSRGRFAGIMSHLSLALRDGHTCCYDATVSYSTPLNPGVPVLVCGGWGSNDHFGACLTPMPDSSLLVYRTIPGHPLGLVRGDLVLGYDQVPWKELCKQLIVAQLPISGWWGDCESAYEHSWLIAAGMNWHLFDTIDIVKYATGDTLHLSTAPLLGLTASIFGTEQMDIPGVSMPDFFAGDYVSWGIVTGTQIGYIYVMAWSGTAGDEFYEAVSDLMFNHTTSGLIIDFRMNAGGNMFLSDAGLAVLFNKTVTTINFALRSDPDDHLAMRVPSDPSYYEIVGDTLTYYDKPIAVLTGPGAGSSGDQVALRMKFHPRARFFGKSTAAAFNARAPLNIGFSGWYAYYASADAFLVSAPGHYLTRDELVVDEEVWLIQDDVAEGHDTVVEAAIDWINTSTATLLKTFHAEARGPNIEIAWVLQEADPDIKFVVTRSDDGAAFAEIDVDVVETAKWCWSCLDEGVRPAAEYVYRVDYVDGGKRSRLFETEALRTPPAVLAIFQNHPNPFNPSTSIGYVLPDASDVRIDICDVSGRRIRTLVSSNQRAGRHAVEWDGRDEHGREAASGLYFCRLQAGKAKRTMKMVLLR